jgi:adenylate kinase
MNILIFGPQASGKGTQADLIGREFNIPHISSGDLFRDNIKNNTLLGAQAKQYIDKGQLVPDEVTNKMVRDRLRQIDCQPGFILDGYPRNLDQLKFLLTYTTIDMAIDLELTDDESIERISGRRVCAKCGKGYHINYLRPMIVDVCDACQGKLVRRSDDEPETVTKRLEIYHTQTEPILDYLNENGLLKTVNGSQPIEEVFRDVKLMLNKKF